MAKYLSNRGGTPEVHDNFIRKFRSATNYAAGLCELILQNRFENDKEIRIHKIK